MGDGVTSGRHICPPYGDTRENRPEIKNITFGHLKVVSTPWTNVPSPQLYVAKHPPGVGIRLCGFFWEFFMCQENGYYLPIPRHMRPLRQHPPASCCPRPKSLLSFAPLNIPVCPSQYGRTVCPTINYVYTT